LCRRLGMQAYSCDTSSRTDRPLIQRSSQNLLDRPLPRAMVVDVKKRSFSLAENWRSRPVHALLLSVLLSHCHRKRSANPVRSRFWMPRPLREVGRHTRLQFTWQLPPLAAAHPSQRKPHSIFSIFLKIIFGGASTSNWSRGIAPRTNFAKASLPGFYMSLDF
jgi:hypothetical protein